MKSGGMNRTSWKNHELELKLQKECGGHNSCLQQLTEQMQEV